MEQVRIVPVELSNGQKLRVEATSLGGEERVADGKDLKLQFGEVLGVVEAFAADLGQLLTRVSPEKAAIEFGVEVGVESGRLTTLLVKGTGKANLKITLEWTKPPGPQPPVPAQAPAAAAAEADDLKTGQ